MSLLIGKHIYNALLSDSDVNAMVEGRIFPLVIQEGARRPFIVFNEVNVIGEYTKDGAAGDIATVNVICVADTYEDTADLAHNVRIALEQSEKQYDEYSTGGAELKKSSDAYENGVYVIILNLEFETF